MEKKANNEDKIMWKVMIVDDEKLICKLVQALVEWDKLGMQMAAQAENAIQALDIVSATDCSFPLNVIPRKKQRFTAVVSPN